MMKIASVRLIAAAGLCGLLVLAGCAKDTVRYGDARGVETVTNEFGSTDPQQNKAAGAAQIDHWIFSISQNWLPVYEGHRSVCRHVRAWRYSWLSRIRRKSTALLIGATALTAILLFSYISSGFQTSSSQARIPSRSIQRNL